MRATDDCVAYFKNNIGFARLMEGMYDLYLRYERCYGAVRLVRPTPEEEKTISDFFKRDYYNQALIRIGLADFERQAQKVLSPDIKLETLLEMYFGKRIARRPAPRIVNAFTLYVENELAPRYIGTEAELWLREVSTHVRRGYRVWADRYNLEPKQVARMLEIVSEALTDLPVDKQKIERLSDFSLRFAKDAHFMDISSECGPLFIRALIKRFEVSYPPTPEECSALYYKAGLLTEGVLNTVAIRGLNTRCGDMPDEACAAYDHRNEAHVLTLENVNRITEVTAYGGKAFIMENLTVFSAVSERLTDTKCTLICAENGINPALTLLLDLLCRSGTALYYSGDMDYMGLCRADRFYLAYTKYFIPWRYGKTDYEKIMSDNDFFLPENKKETGLHNEDLASLLSLMRKRGKTAPQSALIPDLAQDIRDMIR